MFQIVSLVRDLCAWLGRKRLDVMDLVAGVASPAVVIAGLPWVLSYLFRAHSLELPPWIDLPWLMATSSACFAMGLLSSTLVAWHTRLRLTADDEEARRDRAWLTVFGSVDLTVFAWMVTVTGFEESSDSSLAEMTGWWWVDLLKFLAVGGGLEVAVLGSLYARSVHKRLAATDERFDVLRSEIQRLEKEKSELEKSKSDLFATICRVADGLNGKGASRNELRLFLRLLAAQHGPVSEKWLRDQLGVSSSLGTALEGLCAAGYAERIDAKSIRSDSPFTWLYQVANGAG